VPTKVATRPAVRGSHGRRDDVPLIAACHNACVRDERPSVLWLCGPMGAGKSAAGWALYDGLARSGARAGFVDLDQLGMCFPAPPDDPRRFRLKEHNASAVAANFREADCDAFVVSGHLGPSRAISSGTVDGASLTICRLRASPGELRRRLTTRGAPDLLAESLREAEELDRSSFADASVDTDGLTVAEVARLVRERCGGWPPERVAAAPAADAAPVSLPAAAAGADGEVLLVCGATGVGKSAVGFEVFLRQLRAGVAAAYVDLDQIGFMSAVPADDLGGYRLRARNLADLWRAYHEAGARRLVLSGPVPDARAAAVYVGALPAADVTVCRLHAGLAELARRITRRGQGFSWLQPGDPLVGQPEASLRLAAERAAADADALDRSGLGDLRIDTDGLSVGEAADLVSRRW
jgi:hypothetical protein